MKEKCIDNQFFRVTKIFLYISPYFHTCCYFSNCSQYSNLNMLEMLLKDWKAFSKPGLQNYINFCTTSASIRRNIELQSKK